MNCVVSEIVAILILCVIRTKSKSDIFVDEGASIFDNFGNHSHMVMARVNSGSCGNYYIDSLIDYTWVLERRKFYFKILSNYSTDVILELAIFADIAFTRKMKRRKEVVVNYTLKVVKQIEQIYRYKSMKSIANFTFQVNYLETDVVTNETLTSGNYYNEFRKYVAKRKWKSKKSGNDWDLALVFTGINLFNVDEKTNQVKTDTVGLSGVPQVCYQNGVAMAESKSYNTVLTMAHEIGHSLGVIHDGSDEAEDCDHEKFIMSPTTGIGKLDWSLCALRQIKSTLVDSTAKCLFEKNGSPIKEWLQQTAGSSLEEQCYFGYGSSFKPHELKPYQKVCSTLFCKSSFFMVAANPAVDGSPCKGIYMEQPTIGKCCKGRCIIQQAQCE